MAGNSPLQDPLGHSTDSDVFHFPGGHELDIHRISGEYLGDSLAFLGIHGLSRFMALEVLAVILLLVLLVPFALLMRVRGYPRGRLSNVLESMLLFIRDNVAVPAIGHHDADKHLPFLWSIFFFILANNLLGMVPNFGSPTGALGCTVGIAICTFIYIHLSGIAKMGGVAYAKAFVPHVPLALYPLMFIIELVGHLIRPTVLAVRLFVNMLAGHTVLYVITAFIAMIGPSMLYFIVAPAAVLGSVGLSLLELFVAFLQAYVFTFLSAIFIGGAVHPHH